MFRLVDDLPRTDVIDLLSRSPAAPYDLGKVADEKLREGFGGEPSILAALVGDAPAGVAVTCGEYLRLLVVDPSWRRRGAGTALLKEAERRIPAESRRIIVAAEPGNYFTPGVLPEFAGFFLRRGYEVTSEASNLFAPTAVGESAGVRRATAADRGPAIDWVRGTFGPIWAFEATRCFEHQRPTMVLAEPNGELAGFSAWRANNAALGAYGPAGVATAFRGRGLGRDLLVATLSEMRADGFPRALIQWAAAVPFYARVAGAEVAHRFLVLEKRRSA
jgi:mycothiol synthase